MSFQSCLDLRHVSLYGEKKIPVIAAAAHAAPVSVYFKLRIFCSFLKTNFSFLENIFWAPEFQ